MLQQSGTTKHTTTLDQVKLKNSRDIGRCTTPRTAGTTPHKSLRPANVSNAEINLTPDINVQLKMLNATNAKERTFQ